MVGVPNSFIADRLKTHYRKQIDAVLAGLTNPPKTVAFKVISNLAPEPEPVNTAIVPEQTAIPPDAEPAQLLHLPALNPRYKFDHFVVGDSNEFSHAAAMAVAESPGETRFNPLYIYGGVGLGKTHLIQGIGHFIRETHPNLRVLYATSEKFTNDFISSLSTSTTGDFTKLYRSIDILLLDDIQFFTGKESTQVQFFHTFNTLHQNGKQIVLTSDRPPKDIQGLEERLLSRFQWGLVTDIQPPDFETRMAILKKKLETEEMTFPDDVLSYIASNVRSNIRELEGSLIRLLAFSSLRKQPVDLPLAQSILKDTLSAKEQPVTIEAILTQVSRSFKVPEELIKSKRKTQDVAQARQVAMYLARTLTQMSLKAIGTSLGNRDHSTVIHSVNLIRGSLRQNRQLKSQIDTIINLLYRPAMSA